MKAIGSAALIVPVLLACASTSEPAEHEGRIVLTGRITVTGSAPHVKLVIVTDDRTYELVGETSAGLWRGPTSMPPAHWLWNPCSGER